jgi:hypothetical protein
LEVLARTDGEHGHAELYAVRVYLRQLTDRFKNARAAGVTRALPLCFPEHEPESPEPNRDMYRGGYWLCGSRQRNEPEIAHVVAGVYGGLDGVLEEARFAWRSRPRHAANSGARPRSSAPSLPGDRVAILAEDASEPVRLAAHPPDGGAVLHGERRLVRSRPVRSEVLRHVRRAGRVVADDLDTSTFSSPTQASTVCKRAPTR